MKILVISTSEVGGAFVSAERLTRGLRESGIEATLLTRNRYIRKNGRLRFQLLSKLNTFASGFLAKKPYEQIAPFSVSYLKNSEIYKLNPDLIHIHNWFNFLSLDQLDELIKNFPVVFTMHDVRLLTGGCFFTHGCRRNLDGCNDCPALLFPKSIVANARLRIKNIFEREFPYTIIAPSHWIQNQVIRAFPNILASKVKLIPNITNNNSSSLIKIPNSTQNQPFEILFIAADISQPLKGLKILLDAIKNFNDNIKLKVVGGGERPKNWASLNNVEFLGTLNDCELQSQMRTSDALIVPSSIENRPNVILEAQFFGLFILASNVGGIPEMVRDTMTGLLFEPTEEDISKTLKRYIELSENERFEIRQAGRNYALKSNQQRKVIEMHIELYKNLVNEFKAMSRSGNS